VQHTVEVIAESLYEAIARGLVILRENDWAMDVGTGMTPVTVAVREPVVTHRVLMKDFERWLNRDGRSPAEHLQRAESRRLLGR
jgi:hypothetical protein